MKRGLTLAELMASMLALLMALGAALSLQVGASRSMNRIQSDLNVSSPSAQAMRRVSETLRGAMSVSISSDGKTITYLLPRVSSTSDPVTGEKELVFPLQSDGVTRSYVISGNNLISNPGGRVLVRNISSTDPRQGSTQYNQTYSPFQSTTIGSRRAITITLICKETANGAVRYARMKSTVLIQNS